MRRVKYCLDRVVAVLALTVLLPALALVAVAIKLDSPGPVFFRQRRPGRFGEFFRVFKFRTMIDRAESFGLGVEVCRDDERITRVGKWLRLSSFDEAPQLINVLLGQMSLIGPRPAAPHHLERYTPHQRRRLEAHPGLTGWAQVNGRNSLSWEERIELDIWYVDHWSLWLDLRILLRTPRALLDSDGLYGPDGVTSDLGTIPLGGRVEPSEDPSRS
jgi:lipopolysaccharide/colanic/teichoic acid biosynthesis glycosyltransferase